MKFLTKLSCVLTAIISIFICVGCTGGYSPDKVINLFRFNTDVHIEVYDKPISAETKNRISTILLDLENEISLTKQGSKIKLFNESAINTPVTFSERAYELLSLAKDYTTQTCNKFNLAVYPLVKLWGFASEDYPLPTFTPPAVDQIAVAKELSTPAHLFLNDTDNTAHKSIDGAKIDLGGIAKGYATDLILDILKADGHTDGYISVGGSSMYILSLKNRNSTFSIRHPENRNQTILSFHKDTVQSTAVSTSGDYERYYELNGKRYSHVIDSQTGAPSDTGVISASVLGGKACFSDTLTTALMLCEFDTDNPENSELVKFINQTLKSYPKLKFFVFYKKDGVKRLITNATQGYTLLDTSFSIENI